MVIEVVGAVGCEVAAGAFATMAVRLLSLVHVVVVAGDIRRCLQPLMSKPSVEARLSSLRWEPIPWRHALTLIVYAHPRALSARLTAEPQWLGVSNDGLCVLARTI
jgi:hypothetical protein